MFTIPLNEALAAKSTMRHQEKIMFTDDEPYPIWGIQAASGTLHSADLTPELLSQTEWALVLMLSFE